MKFLRIGVIGVDDFEQDLGGDVFDVFSSEKAAARVSDVLDHVVDQSHVPIDEVLPGTRFLPQAAINQLAVNVAQGHCGCLLSDEEGSGGQEDA